MKISIITPTYNSSKTLSRTMESVISQSYKDIEYIVIDGNSSDGTQSIVSEYKNKLDIKFISEKDKGIYDAMNKGIKLATGDIVGILNSDDFYISDNVIEMVVDVFKKNDVDCVWGDLIIVDGSDLNKVIRNWKSLPYKKGIFQKGWHPPHPTFFVKNNIYKKYGLYRTDLSTWADYELMLRFLEKEKITSAYIPQVLVKMRGGGESNKSYWHLIKANFGCYRAFKINGLKIDLFFVFRKPLFKLSQFFGN